MTASEIARFTKRCDRAKVSVPPPESDLVLETSSGEGLPT
jgi:hypothetical protein